MIKKLNSFLFLVFIVTSCLSNRGYNSQQLTENLNSIERKFHTNALLSSDDLNVIYTYLKIYPKYQHPSLSSRRIAQYVAYTQERELLSFYLKKSLSETGLEEGKKFLLQERPELTKYFLDYHTSRK